VEKREKSGQKLKKKFLGFFRSKTLKNVINDFEGFDLKNQKKIFLSFCPLFLSFPHCALVQNLPFEVGKVVFRQLRPLFIGYLRLKPRFTEVRKSQPMKQRHTIFARVIFTGFFFLVAAWRHFLEIRRESIQTVEPSVVCFYSAIGEIHVEIGKRGLLQVSCIRESLQFSCFTRFEGFFVCGVLLIDDCCPVECG